MLGLQTHEGKTHIPCSSTFGKSTSKYYKGNSKMCPTVNEDNFKTSVNKERFARERFQKEGPPPRKQDVLDGSGPPPLPAAIDLDDPAHVDLLEVGALRHQCRAMGVSCAGRREDMAAALKAVLQLRQQGRSITRAKTSQGLRSHRRPPPLDNFDATVSSINQKTHDAWAWDVKPPGLWKNGLPVPKAGGNEKRARTSSGKRRMRGGAGAGGASQTSSSRAGSGMDKAAVKAVLASNAKLMGQMSAIRHRLSDVNNVIDDAETTQQASPTTSPSFDQVHHERLRKASQSAASSRCSSKMTPYCLKTSKDSDHNKPYQRGSDDNHKPAQRASTPVQYISASARRLLGPAIPYTTPTSIPGVQKIGVQRGAGENGQMRGDGKTTVTFCEAPNSLSHRMGMMHRTHNMAALGDAWKGRACNKILPFHSFKLDQTRAELLQEGVVA